MSNYPAVATQAFLRVRIWKMCVLLSIGGMLYNAGRVWNFHRMERNFVTRYLQGASWPRNGREWLGTLVELVERHAPAGSKVYYWHLENASSRTGPLQTATGGTYFLYPTRLYIYDYRLMPDMDFVLVERERRHGFEKYNREKLAGRFELAASNQDYLLYRRRQKPGS